MRRTLAAIVLSLGVLQASAQCLGTATFDIPESVCSGEFVAITNNSTGSVSYQWDFCSLDEVEDTPSTTRIASSSSFGTSNYIEIVEDGGVYYGFVPSRTSDFLVRLDFDNGLGAEPGYNNLGNLSALDDPVDIALVKDSDDVWRALVTGLTTDKLWLLEFNSGLEAAPTVTDITGTLGVSRPNSVEIVEDGGTYYAFIVNNESGQYPMLLLDFGSSLASAKTTAPSETNLTVTGSNGLTTISMIKECDEWYGFVVSRTNTELYRLEFGTDLTSIDTQTALESPSGLTFNDPSAPFAIQEGDSSYVFVQSRNGNLYRLDFGSSFANSPEGNDLGNVYGTSRGWGLSFVKDSTSWHGFNANFLGRIYRLDFDGNCAASTAISTETTPTGISYASAGTYYISLSATDASGNIDRYTDTLVVTGDVAPDISFTVDESRCIANENTFTADPSTGLNYSWDFDGDNMEDGTLGIETYQFAGAGTYTTTLTVTDGGGCTNSTSQELTIYNEPPVPAFTITGIECSGSELTFTNDTDETGFDDVLSYVWDFDGEGSSTQSDTTFVFGSAGLKDISLIVNLPGCADTTVQQVTLGDGPAASFSFTNNCLGEAVVFDNLTLGADTLSHSWDFGDGSGTSTLESPNYTYAGGGTFSVSLTVSDGSCESEVSNDVTIDAGDLAGFDITGSEENVPVSFAGVDSTHAADAIDTWSWDFDDLGVSTDQSTSFTFSTPGTYDISLEVTTTQGCADSVGTTITIFDAVCPTASFDLSSATVCIGEGVSFTNTSGNAVSYSWDFCSLDQLEDTPTITEISTSSSFGSSNYIEVVEDGGNYYGFVPTRTTDFLARLDFGDSLYADPIYTNLGNLGALDDPVDISLVKESDDVWRALVTGLTTDKLWLLEFNSGLNAVPDVTDITGTLGVSRPNSVEIVEDAGSYYAIIVNNESGQYPMLLLDFGSSLASAKTTAPTETNLTVTGSNGLTTISMIKECNEWFGFVVSRTNTEVFRLDFGTDLTSIDAITALESPSGLTFTDPSASFAVQEGDSSYVFVQSRSGNLYRLDFGASFANSPTGTDLGNVYGVSRGWGLSFVKDSTTWYGFNANFDGAIYRIDFPANCSANTSISTDTNPTNITYGAAGTYAVSLSAYDENGNVDHYTDTLVVTGDVAPSISFTVDESRCIANENTFTADPSTGLNYSWDFDGDNMEDGTLGIETYQFATAGTYITTLTVSDGSGCSNTASQEITIYEEPPIPAFTITGSECSASELTFTNGTDETGYDDVLSYVWDFGGEGSSTQRDTTFVFSSAGLKDISLIVNLPGCADTTMQQVTLGEGPAAAFSFTNNCLGEAVVFDNLTPGADTLTHSWDFGDGSGTSALESPNYTYAGGGTFSVSLTVSDGACETEVTDDVTVDTGDLAGFDITGSEENIPVSFVGVDSTHSGDGIDSWSWDFDGLGNSTDQSTTFTFSTPGDYTISLEVTTTQGCTDSVATTLTILEALCPTASFSPSSSTICVGEAVNFTNTSVNATNYLWDFCSLDQLEDTPSSTEILSSSNFGISNYIEIVEDGGNYYGFVPTRTGDFLVRLDFGDSLDTDPRYVDLGDLGSLDDPVDIALVKESDDVWRALVTGLTTDKLWLLEFNSGITSEPDVTDITGTLGVSRPNSVEIVESGGSYYAIVVNNESGEYPMLLLNFGASLATAKTTAPTETNLTVTGSDGLTTISMIQECNEWYGFVVSRSNKEVYRLEFGTDLTSINSSTALESLTGLTFDDPSASFALQEGDSSYVFVQSRNGNLYRLDFGSTFSNAPDGNDLGNVYGVTRGWGLSFVKDNTTWYGFNANFDGDIFRLAFDGSCAASTSVSNETAPAGVTFASSGTYYISLSAIDENGNVDRQTETILVTANTAPSISISIDSSRCQLNANTFTGEPSIGLSYSWDFNGEGSGNSGVETFQFPTSGEKTVLLTVSDGICSNQTIETLTIYPAPPDPVFDFDQAQYCAELDFEVNNTTDDAVFNGNLAYEWIVEADSDLVFSGPDPTFNVPPIGTFLVTAQTSVPGCESNIVTDSVTIEDSPATDFSYTPTCDGEITEFTNLTTGGISQQWDFGDNFTSTQFAPDHYYDSVTTYLVTLTAFNELGCSRIHTDSVTIGNLPVPGFRVTQACEGDVALEDTSTVVGADIAMWEWSLENELFSSVQNPTQEITEPGTYLVRQKVTSSAGCESEVLQEITVFDAAEVAFVTAQACDGDPFTFTDASSTINGNPIISRSWDINGTLYSDAELQHTFPSPGEYDATLVVTTQNLCTASQTETVTVYDVPALDFSTLGGCQHEYLTIDDRSAAGNDTIISRSWYLDGQIIGSGKTLQYRFDNHGANTVTLTTVTEQGCVYELAQDIDIAPAAVAAFESSTTFGDVGTQIVFDNTSTLGSNFLWRVGEDSAATSQNFSYQFDESGDFSVSLIAVSDFNCADTIIQDIRIRRPEVDLIINEMILQQEDEQFSTIVVSLENQSNLPVDDLIFTVTVDEQLPTRDRLSDVVEIGETRVFQLGTSVPNQATFICVEVASGYSTEDASPGDNEFCVNIEPKVIFQDPYPNPASDETVVRTILPEGGDVTLTLIDVSGKIELKETYKDLLPGLQAFTVALQHLEAGMYVLRIEHNGQIDTKRILKQ